MFFFNFEKIKILFKILKINLIKSINVLFFFNTLNNLLSKKKFIILKFGIDPTNNNIHIGHIYYFLKIILLKKIKFLKIFIIIGISTSIIDNYKNKKNILKNSLYIFYNIKYLIKRNLKKIKIYYNNEWIKLINLKEKIFLSTIIKNNIFTNIKKYKNFYKNIEYLIIQTYDSIFINFNIEIGGGDQYFNFIFSYNYLINFLGNKQFYFLYFILLKNKFKKFSKSLKDNFFNFKKIFFYLKKIKIKILIKNYYKNFFNNNFINYNFLNFKNYYLKKNIIKRFYFNFYKKFFLEKIKKIFYICKNLSLTYFKVLKIIFLKKKNNFLINNILILNKNFIFIKGNYKIKINKKIKFLMLI